MNSTVEGRLFIRGRVCDEEAVTHVVMSELATDLRNTPKLEALASRFCVSARTFSRRLKSMGMSYRGIVEEVRRREAIDRLTNSDVSIAEISMSLGYADASNFSKAFKSWTGKSPKQYRLPKYQRARSL